MNKEYEDYSEYISKPNRRGVQRRDEKIPASGNFRLDLQFPGKIFEPRRRQAYDRPSLKRKIK